MDAIGRLQTTISGGLHKPTKVVGIAAYVAKNERCP